MILKGLLHEIFASSSHGLDKRHKNWFSRHENVDFHPIKMLYQHATAKATHLFNVFCTQVNKLPCEFYLIKENEKKPCEK